MFLPCGVQKLLPSLCGRTLTALCNTIGTLLCLQIAQQPFITQLTVIQPNIVFATILLIIIPPSLFAVDVFPFLGVFYPCRSLPTSKRREKFQDIHNTTELVSNAGIGHLFTHSYVCINYNITLSITCNYTRLPLARALGSLKTTFTTIYVLIPVVEEENLTRLHNN